MSREYATKDISNIVDIAPPTVRKYAQALEKTGYLFIKNENGFRIFTDKDILVFQEMKSISNSKGMPVEQIAKMIVFNQRQEIQHEATSDTVEIIQAGSGDTSDLVPYDNRYNELLSKLDKLDMIDDIAKELQEVKETNKQLLEQMKKQNEYINQSLIERDQRLLESIRSMQQARLEVATTQQEQKKSFWQRLFSKHK